MGYYTFSFADRPLKYTKDGDIAARCKLPYGGYGRLLCPDGTSIPEPSYDGYGEFGGKDVFELLADWNKSAIPGLVKSGAMDGAWENDCVAPIALAFAADDRDALQAAIADAKGKGFFVNDEEWKRIVGIWLNSADDAIPFPIKIVSTRRKRYDYASMPCSVQCQ